jgi:hypothetical protein
VVAEASITGLFRTILIIIGVFVLLRFIGQLMMAKRNMEDERRLNERQRKADKERSDKLHNFGKTNIINRRSASKSTAKHSDIEDVDYEELP